MYIPRQHNCATDTPRKLARIRLLSDCPRCNGLLTDLPYRGPWSSTLYCAKCKTEYAPAVAGVQEAWDAYLARGYWKDMNAFVEAMLRGFIASF